MRPIINVENLSKRYRIGGGRAPYRTLRESLAEAFSGLGRDRRGGARRGADGAVWALKEVNFSVSPGEAVGIVGPNGAGKSTLLKLVSCITEPTSGCVELYGQVASLLEVGTGFHPELTGRENVYLHGAILGMKREEIRRKFDEIVAFAGVEEFLDTPVKHYSSGMHLRLAFAVASHIETEILVMDEVLAVGDAEFQRRCLGKVEGAARQGRTILFVSHNTAAITQLCQRALWLNEGRVEMDGGAPEVVSKYLASGHGDSHRWERRRSDEVAAQGAQMLLCSAIIWQGGQPSEGVVRFDRDFSLEVGYEVIKPVGDAGVWMRLVSESGVIVLTSWDTDPGGQGESLRSPGRYTSTCTVPGNLLHPGSYFVSLGAVRSKQVIDLQEHVLRFEVSPVGYTLNIGRRGVITPILDWNVRAVDLKDD